MKNFAGKLKIAERDGVASLGTILILAAVVIEIALVGFVLSTFLTASNYGARLAGNALAAAQAAIADGLIRLTRGDYADDVLYEFSVGNAQASLTICQGGNFYTGSSPCGDLTALPPQKLQIHASGIALPKKFKLLGTVEVDPATGRVTVESVTEPVI